MFQPKLTVTTFKISITRNSIVGDLLYSREFSKTQIATMHKQSKSRSKANDFNPLSSRKFLIKFSPEENVSSYYQKWV